MPIEQELSRIALLETVRSLPDDAPISASIHHSPLKQVWIDWLAEYEKWDQRKNPNRDAHFIYNALNHPPMILWLAEASGVETRLIREALATIDQSKDRGTQAATIRRVLPWELVVPYLLQRKMRRAIPPDDATFDIEQIRSDPRIKSETTRQALIQARLGQGQFRADVGKHWDNRCAVTDCGLSAVLRASHVKPWSQCTNRERLDPANGFLLAAHIDALFDRGLVSFAANGDMLVSNLISAEERQRFQLPGSLKRKLTKSEKRFLEYHRRYVFNPS
jgi:hypothetical protein